MKNPHLTPEVLVPRLGDYLLEMRLITPEQLQDSLRYQQEKTAQGEPILLGQALIDLGYLDRATLDEAVTKQIIKLRQALQDANRYLERRVEERTAELQEALQKLSELNQLKSNFVANISHELRTPLAHIKGYLELLATESLGPLNDKQKQALRVSRNSTRKLEKLIDDLILFSLASKGALSLHLEDTDLTDLVALVLPAAQQKAEKKHIALKISIAEDLPLVRADAERLTWALEQLLDNAIKFTDENGTVQLDIHREGGNLVAVSVQDSGIGIAPERLEEIFEPFHQLDGSSTRRYGGTGLGLFLVKEIVEAHGSLIEVSSQRGEGTTFKFYLTVDPKHAKVVL